MNTGYELLLPEGLLDFFVVKDVCKTSECITIYLDELDLSAVERSGRRLESKGFYPSSRVHDFPLRGKSLFLQIRRRRWLDLDTGNPYTRDWDMVAKGTRLTAEFASFLKETP